jgi:PAS domain S-box-containing protein
MAERIGLAQLKRGLTLANRPPAPEPKRPFWLSSVPVEGTLTDLSASTVEADEFRLLADHLPAACWLANGDGYIVWYSRRWHDYCGTTPAAMEGWGWRAVHDPQLLPEIERQWTEALATGEPFAMTFPLRGADGVFRPFQTRATPVRDSTGSVRRWFGINTEVSDLVATERAARGAEARLRRVLNGMGEGFALLDHDFRILDVNEEALRLESCPREALIGRTHWEAHPGTEESEIGRLYKRAMSERVPVELEHCYEWGDGRHTWLEMRAFPVEEGLAIFFRDITERHEAERALRREAERVQLALDAGAIIGTWDWDLIRDSFSVDERFATAFGLDPKLGREGLSLEQVIATVHPEDRDGLTAAIDEAVTRGGRYAHQYRVRRADGRYYWIEANGRVDKDETGASVRFPGVLLDVESRRAVEQERDQALTLLRTFTNAVPGVVYAKDRDGRMLAANRGTSELVGKPLPDVIGRTDAEFLDDAEQAALVMANDRRIMDSGEVEQLEEEISFPDGSRAVWLSTKAPLLDNDGKVVGLVGSSVDITERKEVQARLAESEARYRTLFDTIDEGFCVIEFIDGPHGPLSDYIHVEANTAYATNAGIPDIVGKRLREVVGDEADLWVRTFRGVLETREAIRFEQELTATGRYLELAAFPVEPPERRQVAVLFKDVTARKRAEDALRDLNASLESRVDAAIAEREQVEEALRQAQKMEAVGQLTGGIAHDFNNLLTIVTGNVDMATRALQAAGVSDARSKRALESAMKGAERAAALTQRLLAFSRKQPLAPKPLDVDKLVAAMSDMLNRTLGETVKVEIVTSPGLWRVEADPNQLESAILNLAVNARDAMPKGGTLTIETANARLDDAYAANHAEVAPGNYVVIAVTDTGKGMDRDTLSRVFEPFFTTKEVGKGTGLGLSQIYGFTKQSGGHVKIYSEEDQGTTVKIYLPRLLSDAGDEPGSGNLVEGLEVSRQQEMILAVEDDDDVRAYTVECLRELGYRVLEAHDGPSAIRLMERQAEPIDLLFTDVVMPNMSGRELADELRQRQPDLKVLYTSGYTRNAIVHGGRLDEGVEMIAKPFTFQALAAKVRDMLESGRNQRVLIVEDEPTVRAFVAEALGGLGYAADEAATAAEALMKVRAAQGRYDVIVLDAALPDKKGDSLLAELRALHMDMPVLIASGEHAAELAEKFAGDRCTGVLPKPYTGAKLAEALRDLGLRCAAMPKVS